MPGRKRAAPKTRAKAAPARVAKTVAAKAAAAANGASAAATKLAAEIERSLKSGKPELLSQEAVQALMAAACKSYAARLEAGDDFMPLGQRSGVTPTEIMVTASKLLRAGNLQVFELGMWQSWTGR